MDFWPTNTRNGVVIIQEVETFKFKLLVDLVSVEVSLPASLMTCCFDHLPRLGKKVLPEASF